MFHDEFCVSPFSSLFFEDVKSVRQKFQSKANTDLKDQIVRELQASYLYQAYVSKVNADLKSNMNGDILLQTTPIFFFYRTLILNRVLTRCMSWMISFARASSSCKERKRDLQNEKSLAHSWTRTHDLWIVKPPP